MVQIENEYGFCGTDAGYLRHLKTSAHQLLGEDVLLYTTDPAHVASTGTLPGDEVFTTVDFGPGWFYPNEFYAVQKSLNAPGKSPPMCSEFYTGWLSHWGESMANTSAIALANDTRILLQWANGTGNLNFYMVHGESVIL
jgi:beta-galactosidase